MSWVHFRFSAPLPCVETRTGVSRTHDGKIDICFFKNRLRGDASLKRHFCTFRLMEHCSTPLAVLRFDESSSLLHVTIQEGVVMDKKNLEKHYQMIEKITKGKKHLTLVDASQPYFIDDEGIQFAASADIIKNQIAAAYYNPPLSNRLSIMNLQQIIAGRIPTFIAVEKEIALKWLSTLKI